MGWWIVGIQFPVAPVPEPPHPEHPVEMEMNYLIAGL